MRISDWSSDVCSSDLGARRMRIVATGLLVLMAAIYIAARSVESVHPAVGFVRAFAEAAMVGGLADWFAVTALFRLPLGLPIPHTAIIPRKKDRIGDPLTIFLRDNFLPPTGFAPRMYLMAFSSQDRKADKQGKRLSVH